MYIIYNMTLCYLKLTCNTGGAEMKEGMNGGVAQPGESERLLVARSLDRSQPPPPSV